MGKSRPLAQLLSAHGIGERGVGFDSRNGQIGTVSPAVRHRCDAFLELCSPSAKLRRWAALLVTRFGIIPRIL